MTEPKPKQTKRTIYSANARLTLSKQPSTPAAPETPAGTDVEEQITLKGYPIVWNALSTDRGGYKVRLIPGSASFTDPCLALYHHEYRDLLGNTANTTLRILPADEIGIPVEIDVPGTTTAADVAELIEDKYLNGMSFSMVNGWEDSYTTIEGGETVINVTKFTCDEVTVTVIPAFTSTSIELANPDVQDEEEVEKENSESSKEQMAAQLKIDEHRLYLHGLNVGRVSADKPSAQN